MTPNFQNIKITVPLLIASVSFITSFSFGQVSIVRQKDIGGNKDEILSCVIQTKDGGLLLAGTSNSDSSFDKSQSNIKEQDFWVVKLYKK